MWTFFFAGAWALDVTVCPSVCTYDTLEAAALAHRGEAQLTVRLLDDLQVATTATFREHDELRFESGTDGPFVVRAANGLTADAPLIVTGADVGEVTFDGLGLGRGGASPGAGVRLGGPATLTGVVVEQHQGAGEPLVWADDALTLEGVQVCGGTVDGPLVQAFGPATLDGVIVEGLGGLGTAFELSGGGSLGHVTVASPALALGVRGIDADLQVTASVIEAQAAVATTGGALVTVDRSGFRGPAQGLSDPGLDVSVEPWLRADDGAHCGLDARPHPGSALWDATGDHVGGYHGVSPYEGWDDDDADGFGYGDDCDDGDAARSPDADEVCDAVDMDCDGAAYGGTVPAGLGESTWPDADGDGLGAYGAEPYSWCEGRVEAGWVDNDDDCDDTLEGAHTTTFHRDADGDGVPDPDATTEACEAPAGYLLAEGDLWDCDDLLSDAYPGAAEDCARTEVDNDCDGQLPASDADCATTPGPTPGGTTGTGTPSTTATSGPTMPAGPTAAAGGCMCSARSGGVAGGLWGAAIALVSVARRRRG